MVNIEPHRVGQSIMRRDTRSDARTSSRTSTEAMRASCISTDSLSSSLKFVLVRQSLDTSRTFLRMPRRVHKGRRGQLAPTVEQCAWHSERAAKRTRHRHARLPALGRRGGPPAFPHKRNSPETLPVPMCKLSRLRQRPSGIQHHHSQIQLPSGLLRLLLPPHPTRWPPRLRRRADPLALRHPPLPHAPRRPLRPRA